LKAKWIAFLLTSLLIFILIAAIVVLIVGKITLNYFTEKVFIDQTINVWGLNILGYASIFIIFFFGISCIYFLNRWFYFI
jgi:membrane protein